MQETAPIFFWKKHEKENMFRLDISNLSMVDVQYPDFEPRFYALMVCCKEILFWYVDIKS
jgi:hypothetical protein